MESLESSDCADRHGVGRSCTARRVGIHGPVRQPAADRIDSQRKETTEQLGQLETGSTPKGKETTEQFGQLRERMAKLEGLLEGLREALTGKRAA